MGGLSMAKILKIGNTPKYKLICNSCNTIAEYDKWELKEWGDCYDHKYVEFCCPVCGKCNSIYKSSLDRYKVVDNENKEKLSYDFLDIVCITTYIVFLIFYIIIVLICLFK